MSNGKRVLAADSVILRNKKILLIKRRHPPFQGKWALPGGLVERDERAMQTCIREAKEETGLSVKPTGILGIYDDPGRDPRGIVTIAFLCRVTGGRIRTSDETLDIGFFDRKTALGLELASDHRKIIQDAFRKDRKVLVGGTFNLIHPGHLYFLRRAKSLGGFLVVVIANDKTVLKNKKYLLCSARERKRMLESIKFVDRVVIGDERDFFKVVRREKPDVIALGYDQDERRIREQLLENCLTCRVVKIKKKLRGYETKNILKRIK